MSEWTHENGALLVLDEVITFHSLDDTALVEHDRVLAVPGDDAEVVGDQEQGRVVTNVLEHVQDLRLHRDVERRRRFVGDQQVRFADQGRGNHRALPHAAGHLVGPGVELALRVREPDARQHVDHPRICRGPAQPRARHGMTQQYLEKILRARVYDVAVESPLERATRLSLRTGNQVLLKREDEQQVFSFKLRGAYNKIARLSEADCANGIIAASAGNHAQGVAMAAQHLGIDAVVVMPAITPEIKVNAVEKLDAKVVIHRDDFVTGCSQTLCNQIPGSGITGETMYKQKWRLMMRGIVDLRPASNV